MSKEELRLSNHAKKLLNESDPKAANGRLERVSNKKRPSAVVKRSIDEVQQVPTNDYVASLTPRSNTLETPNLSEDERLIKMCVNLHKTTFHSKPSQEIDVSSICSCFQMKTFDTASMNEV